MIGTTCLHRIIWTLVYITYLTVQIYMRVLSVGVIESLGWTLVIIKILMFKVQFYLPVYQVLSLLVLTFIHTPITNINVHQQYSKLVPNLLRRQFHVRKTICCLCKYKIQPQLYRNSFWVKPNILFYRLNYICFNASNNWESSCW